MKNLSFISLFCLSLISCTTTQEYNLSVNNSSLTQLNENLYRLDIGGNAFMSESKVKDFALLRVSEISLTKGYKYFEIIENQTTEKKIQFNSPSTTSTFGTANTVGNTTSFNATSKTHNNNAEFEKYRSDILFRLVDESSVNDYSYNAEMIFNSLSSKYLSN